VGEELDLGYGFLLRGRGFWKVANNDGWLANGRKVIWASGGRFCWKWMLEIGGNSLAGAKRSICCDGMLCYATL